MPANVNVDTFEDLFPIIQRVIGSPSAQDHRQGLDRSQEGSSAALTFPRTYIREIWTTKDESGALAAVHPQFERSLYERESKRPTYTL